mgnify:CR=1 FL=1
MTLTDDSRKFTTTSVTTRGGFDHPTSLDELCHALGLSSRGSLQKQSQAMSEAGLVEPMAGSVAYA